MSDIDRYKRLAEKVAYVNGELIWGKCRTRKLNGTKAGRKDSDGYLRIHSGSGKMIAVHRLVYFIHHGTVPPVIDHIDGDITNNRIENLRPATIEQNMHNMRTPKTNTSGRKGVYFSKSTGKWQASIRANGKLLYLGIYSNFDDAVNAREQAEKLYHGEFARH